MRRREFGLGLSAAGMLAAQGQKHAGLIARLEPPSGVVDAVVDSDTYNEIDDQFAVPYAILSAEKMRVHAVYAAPYHNDRSKSAGDGMQKSYEEILRLLGRLRRDPKGFAYQGSEVFLQAAKKPVESAAARNLIERALQPRTGPLYVITVGAPTNVSSAILMEPKILDKIVVVWLGGQPYDWPTAREFNLFQDLHASRVLHDSGVAMVNIPTQNVSEHLRTTTHEVKYFLAGKSPLAEYLHQEFVKFAEGKAKPQTFAYSKVIWDISAVAWLVNPKWVPSKVVPSPYLTDGFQYKAGEASRHPVRVATDCNRDEIFNDLFRKLAAAKS